MSHQPSFNESGGLVRQATDVDLPWINSQYDEIGFVRSDLANEFVAVAEIQGERVGLGRVVEINSGIAELGGMLVLPEYRNRGVARQVMAYLLSYADRFDTLYCLPFEHLSNFYEAHRFSAVSELSGVPNEILQKHRWCSEQYKNRTLLLCRSASQST